MLYFLQDNQIVHCNDSFDATLHRKISAVCHKYDWESCNYPCDIRLSLCHIEYDEFYVWCDTWTFQKMPPQGISVAKIAGAVIGCLAIIGILLLAVYICLKRRANIAIISSLSMQTEANEDMPIIRPNTHSYESLELNVVGNITDEAGQFSIIDLSEDC
jgi:hypothetical protein